MKSVWVWLLLPGVALADVTYTAPARANNIEVKLGGYAPMVDSEKGLNGTPYADTFGSGSMLLFAMEADRYLWQKYGAAGVGLSVAYGEKFGNAFTSDGGVSDVRTNFKSVPIALLGLYRYDYLALNFNIPLVPYLKAGFVYNPWWSGKGSSAVDFPVGPDGKVHRAAGAKWGYELVPGLAFQLDILEPRLAHDFYSDVGVAHTYLFGEFTYANVDDFGGSGLVLSSRHWMFGLSFEY